MLLRAARLGLGHTVHHVSRRTFINQAPGIQRALRAQVKQDFQRVKRHVFYPPLIALAYVASFSVVSFVGIQWWIENRGMAAGEITPYGWESEIEDWSGGAKGGTDPSLGIIPRIALRSAWMFKHWVGEAPKDKNSVAAMFFDPDRGYQLAERQLARVIQYLEASNIPVPPAIILQHVELVEALGEPQLLFTMALPECLALYEKMKKGSVEAMRVALKIASFYERGGEETKKAAEEFWTKPILTMPDNEWSLAHARLVSDIFTHWSAFLMVTDDAAAAFLVADAGGEINTNLLVRASNLLPTSDTPDTFESQLHFLYLTLKAASLLLQRGMSGYSVAIEDRLGSKSMRNVETVLEEGIRFTTQQSAIVLAWLANPNQGDQSSLEPPLQRVHPSLSKSRACAKVAATLERDARTLLIEANTVNGVLLEGKNDVEALRCFKAALEWAGTTTAQADTLGIPKNTVIDLQRKVDKVQSRLDYS